MSTGVPPPWNDADAVGSRVYRSDPGAPTAGELRAEFDRLARLVYVGARDGCLDFEAAFDLACLLIEWGQPDPAVRELAEVNMEGGDRNRAAHLALRVLASTYEPGFDVEPGGLAVLELALTSVRADLAVTGISGPVRLVIPDWAEPPAAFVEFRGDCYGSSPGLMPDSARDPVTALLAVADQTQDSAMEYLCQVWPVCPVQRLGAHPRLHDDTAGWWCARHAI